DDVSRRGSRGSVAVGLVRNGRPDDAVPVLDECVRRSAGRVVPPGMVASLLDLRLRIFAERRDAAGCRATAEMGEKFNGTDAAGLYQAACLRAVTAAVLRAADNSPAATAEADAAGNPAMAPARQPAAP